MCRLFLRGSLAIGALREMQKVGAARSSGVRCAVSPISRKLGCTTNNAYPHHACKTRPRLLGRANVCRVRRRRHRDRARLQARHRGAHGAWLHADCRWRVADGTLAWFATALVLVSILVFAFLVRSIGLAITAVVLAVLCRIAGRYWNWKETTVLALVLAVMVVAIFLKGLGMSLPLWPGQD
jgi:hypothetical protein